MFGKLVAALREKGLDASEVYMVAGQYYDGADHGQVFPVVRVETDLAVPFSFMDGFCKRRGLVYDWRSCYGCGTRLYTIWAAADREQARKLNEKARVFLDAFWMAISKDDSARADNAAGAIAAGRAALAAMERGIKNEVV